MNAPVLKVVAPEPVGILTRLRQDPRRPWSLWGMFGFNGKDFVTLCDLFGELATGLRTTVGAIKTFSDRMEVNEPQVLLVQDDRDPIIEAAEAIADVAGQIGAKATLSSAKYLIEFLQEDRSLREASTLAGAMLRAFHDDFEEHYAVFFDKKEQELFDEGVLTFFGKKCIDSFPSSIYDLDEACKSLVIERGTACVFHLMRSLETVSKALWDSLGVPTKPPTATLRGWGDYRKQVELYLDPNDSRPKPADWSSKQAFYQDAHTHLSTIYKSWRNPVTHEPATKYTQEEAKDVWNGVRVFLRHVAEHIDESGNYTP